MNRINAYYRMDNSKTDHLKYTRLVWYRLDWDPLRFETDVRARFIWNLYRLGNILRFEDNRENLV